jgi:peptide/nickel transport system ATP-binding protein
MAGTGSAHLRPANETLLRVEDLVVRFRSGRGSVQAVSELSFDLVPGETLGLVGESGCGKSSAGRATLQLPRPTSGSVELDGTDLTRLRGRRLRAVRPSIQMIFQDPVSSLNPRRRAGDIVLETARTWGLVEPAERPRRAAELLDAVGLDPATVSDRRPHELAGGQCQRLAIARAMATDPKLLICDEPVSALDVSVQAQILNLLQDMREQHRLTMLFISHDLAVVRITCDRVAVMYLGRLCEIASSDALFAGPAHPYTVALLAANPEPDPDHRTPPEARLRGEVPSAVDPPTGCRFRTRCPWATDRCAAEVPTVQPVGADHFVACHHPRR